MEVFKRSHRLALWCNRFVRSCPREAHFALGPQLLRSSLSVPANIVEGKGRRTAADLARFLTIARGSLEETRYYLLHARDVAYLTTNDANTTINECIEIARMLNAHISRLRAPQ
ncbi:four helix bundle protein [Nibricoccus sp. IMCC34717]|uniref:four helix bundle protein n=1 Tax=Nibricoccus sp. IMCC34717 TaxID=3034021 RepID=UPI0038508360